MTPTPIPISLVVEDVLSEAVLRAIIRQVGRPYEPSTVHGKGGFGWIRRRVRALNQAAQGCPWLILTDLDRNECPPRLIQDWLGLPPSQKSVNLLFRVAVPQVESWLLAHRNAFGQFIGVSSSRIPENPDSVENAKTCLINLARHSRRQWARKDIVPAPNSTAKQGPYYNERLSAFVRDQWQIQEAAAHSESLCRTVNALQSFTPSQATPANLANRRQNF